MGFICKGRFRKQLVSWLYIKNAWLPAIAVCANKLFEELPDPPTNIIPAVENYELTVDGKMTTQTWTPNDTYWIWAEIKINEGIWESMGTDGPNSSSGSFYFENQSPGDVIGFRLRFGDYGGTKFGPWNEQFVTIRNTRIFHAPAGIGFAESFTDGATAVEGQNVNFFVEEEEYITIDHPENLYYLYISGQGLVGDLDLTRCSHLNRLYCNGNDAGQGNGIFSIDVSGLTELQRLRANDMSMLSQFHLSGCTSLSELQLEYSGITNLDISDTNINFLSLHGCENLVSILATGITGSGGKAYFNLNYCNLDANAINDFFTSLGEQDGWKGLIAIEQNPGARNCNPLLATTKGWSVSGGPIEIFTGASPINYSDFQVTGDVTLMHYGNNLYVDDPNGLTGFTMAESSAVGLLNLNNCSNLLTVDLYSAIGLTEVNTQNSTSINSLDVRYCSSLTHLNCSDNTTLGSLNLLGCSSLQIFTSNSCTSLSITNVPTSIVELYLQYQGQDGGLSLSGCSNLTVLYIPGCTLDSLDLTNCTSLNNINVNDCIHLTTIDVSAAEDSLLYLNVGNTGITSFTISAFSALQTISLRDNDSLASISVTNCPSLWQFISHNCPSLTSIDISNNPSLLQVDVQNTGLDESSINNMFASLPIQLGHVYVTGSVGAGTCDTTIATDKTWAVN